MGSATDQVYVTICSTGVHGQRLCDGEWSQYPVVYGGPSSFSGVDQINVLLPVSLAGSGQVALQVTGVGIAANTVQIAIQ